MATIRDIPTILAQRLITIYKNGLRLIHPDTASCPPGKMGHEVLWDDMIVSAINRISDKNLLNLRRWTTVTPYQARFYDNFECCELGDIIYQNRGGAAVGPTIMPGGANSPFPWFPLTNGGFPTFDIPFWNGDGIVQGVNTGTGVYADKQLVRAENGIYQRNDPTLPVPTSTDFLTESALGMWIFIGDFVPITLADFTGRRDGGQLTPNRVYLVQDIAGNVLLIKATENDNYSKDAVLFADYSALPRGTMEWERVTYDIDVMGLGSLGKFYERWDNYGNYACQTSSDVNGSGQPANCIDRAPWGYSLFNGNTLNNVYISGAYTLANLSSYNNNNLKNQVITQSVTTAPFVFDSNIGDTGTFILIGATPTFSNNKTFNGGTVTTTGTGIEWAVADGSGCISSRNGARSRGTNAIASGLRSYAEGNGAQATGTDNVAIGNGALATGSNDAIAIGNDARAVAGVSVAYAGSSRANGVGSSALLLNSRANGLYSVGLGRDGDADAQDSTTHGYLAKSALVTSSATGWFSGMQLYYVPIGAVLRPLAPDPTLVELSTSSATTGRLTMIDGLWTFDLHLAANDFTNNYSAHWAVKGQIRCTGGVAAILPDILYLKSSTGIYTNVYSTVYFDFGAPSNAALTFGVTTNIFQIFMSSDIAELAASIKVLGRLDIVELVDG